MKRLTHRLATLLGAAALIAAAGAHAQATRTWVSGVGDDANPCSRTAPCKTWAGAISKTAAGGEINALDPGGFGALSITKSITIDGTPGPNTGGVLNAGTNGINISAGANDNVTLRGLTIDGATTGLVGVRIFTAGSVHLERLSIFGNTQQGVYDTRTVGGELYVSDVNIRDNGQTGIVILPSSGSTPIYATIDRAQLLNNANSGMALGAGVHATVLNSNISGNMYYGIYVEQPAGTTKVFVSDTTISANGTGMLIGTGAPSVILSNLVVTGNNVGISPGSVNIMSFGNNKIAGNTSGNGPFTPPMTMINPQ